MRILKTILLSVLFLAAASHIHAIDCDTYPVEGIYSTYTGTLMPGRASEAFCNAPYIGGVPGNTQNAASWNYVSLGTQWIAWGMAIDEYGAVETGRSIDEFGDGWITYRTCYDGGEFWLSKDHIWGDGATDFTGDIDDYIVEATVILEGGVAVQVYSTVHFTGSFNECPNAIIDYVLVNVARIWSGDAADLPADYPLLLCGAPSGEAYTVCCGTLQISRDIIGIGEDSWGAIKQLHR
ncbi:MAG: hypothetical protein JW814_01575 [Candidatus Krumholzibacteriota bacterium]|nr:hypothetical protein [Candidatus Krumholzibacteriota bacterium]